ncbi:hypothetical protein [Congregicoccus parvus]|uniref:hypothetical protein n=1 Tax=Congregicoccus parvus TaxID=3081749 RepID=UPI003FA5B729
MPASNDKTRMVMLVTAILWITAVATLFMAFRLRMKPLLVVALLDGAMALVLTTLLVHGARRRGAGR